MFAKRLLKEPLMRKGSVGSALLFRGGGKVREDEGGAGADAGESR